MTTPWPHYWDRHTDGTGTWNQRGPTPGADLAALRRGTRREPGSVPQMWRFYTTLNSDGALTTWLRAEHLALTLFAVHQQSQRRPVHRTGRGLGTALRALRDSDASADAVDRRVAAAATATSLGELGEHLRGLITQLRTVTPLPCLDYTMLVRDLSSWQHPNGQARVRRRWGGQYFTPARPPSAAPAHTPDGPTTEEPV